MYSNKTCSNEAYPIEEPAIRRLAEAIDQLDAGRRSTDDGQLTMRVAALWAMVRDLDPELARLVSRYAEPDGEDARGPAGAGLS